MSRQFAEMKTMKKVDEIHEEINYERYRKKSWGF